VGLVIDTHVHLVATDVERYPWQPNNPDATWFMDHPCPVEDFVDLMDANGIEHAVLVQAMGAYTDDNRYCLDSARAAPGRFVAVVYIDATAPDAEAALTRAAEQGAVGVRIVAGARPGAPGFDAAPIRGLWARAAALDLRILAMTLAPGLPAIRPLLEDDPTTPVAIDHCAFPDLSGGRPFPHARPLFDLAQYPQVHVKISSNVLDLAVEAGARPGDVVAELAAAYGPDRLQWGSNWSHTHDRPYSTLVGEARAAIGGLGDAAPLALSANARAFWFGR
jgi:L-fuconolactonase